MKNLLNTLASLLRPIRPAVGMLLLAPGAALAETPALVSAVLANAPAGESARCGYTRESTNDGETKVERYDPSGEGPPWTLLSFNGRPPSADAQENYADRAEDRQDRQHPLDFELQDRVEPGSWELVSDDGNRAVFGFRLRLDPDENLDVRLLEKISSTITVNKRSAQLERVLIESTEPASVAPLVRITQYRQEYVFSWSEAVNAAVLTEKITRRRGKAAFKSLDQDKRRTYSDYECAVYARELPDEMPVEN